jgi:ferredoxin
MKNKILYYLGFIIALIYSGSIILSIEKYNYFDFYVFWLTGMIITGIIYLSFIPVIEASMLFLTYLIFSHYAGSVFITFPLVVTVLIFADYKAGTGIAPFAGVLWFLGANKIPPGQWNLCQYFIFVSTLITMIIYTVNHFKKVREIRKVDVISCTYSGNTGHFTEEFLKGLREAGTEVKEHFFHYCDFKCDLSGDGLVISFPVYGWKTPWHFAEYILKVLPPGKGKPAFILYTAAGGPENAGIFAYLLLTLKGYRVMGRAWGIYPMNVATFRPLTPALHRYFDGFLPWKGQLNEVFLYGYEFGKGRHTGYPFIFWPFFLVVAGCLLDNRWLNTVAYRNYVWKRRCVRCGICIKFCPVKRLHYGKDNYPVPHGTCTLCLGCINLCPHNAMHLFGWTEYGRPYKPKWPGFINR